MSGLLLLIAALVGGGGPPAKAAPRPSPSPVRSFSLEGTVKGPDGTPVEGAVVVARESLRGDKPAQTVKTDAQGRFRIPGLADTAHDVAVDAKGLAFRVIENAQPSKPLAIALERGATIEGVVRDAATGQPVRGASVGAVSHGAMVAPAAPPELGRRTATTDAQGRFRIGGVTRGAHTVTATARGLGRGSKSGVNAGGRVDFYLVPGASLRGTVVGPAGEPIANALIVLQAPSIRVRPKDPLFARSNAAGRFEIDGVGAGMHRLFAQHASCAPASLEIAINESGETRVSVRLTRGASVVGRLVRGKDRPAAGTVSVLMLGGAPVPAPIAESLRGEAGPEGTFRLGPVPAGALVVEARSPGAAPQRIEAAPAAKEAVVDLGDIVLETGLAIRGRIRSASGAPIADATISGHLFRPGVAGQADARSESDGAFVLAGLQPGTYLLNVEAAGFAAGSRDADAGADGVDVVLNSAGSIAGTVVDGDGRPIPSFVVMAQAPSSDSAGELVRRKEVSSADGLFVLQEVAAGRYSVAVQAPEHPAAVLSGVHVAAGATTDVGRIKLGTGGTVRGAVVDSRGSGIGGATVSARRLGWDMVADVAAASATTNPSGDFEIRGVEAGTTIVAAEHRDYARGRATVQVDPTAGPVDLKITLQQGGRIAGTARRRDGTAIPAAFVHLATMEGDDPFDASRRAAINVDGTFLFEHVVPGRVRVALMNGSGAGFTAGMTREVDVGEGETTTVDFSSRETLVSGRLTRRGTPAAGYQVRLMSRTGLMWFMADAALDLAVKGGPQRLIATTREDGAYEMLVDQPGAYSAMIESLDGRVHFPARAVEVPGVDAFTWNADFGGVTVYGIVVDDETDAPVSRAAVSAMPDAKDNPPPPGRATAGADGRFQIDLEPGDYEFAASASAYGNASVKAAVGADAGPEIRIALPRGLEISGRILDETGRGLAGMDISAARGGEDGTQKYAGFSAPDGSFRIGGLDTGEYNVAGEGPTGSLALRPRVAAGSTDVLLRVLSTGRLAVRVLAADGTPAVAWVALSKWNGETFATFSGSARTNAAGVCEMTLPAGALEVIASAGDAEQLATVSLPANGAATLEVRLPTPPK